MLARGSTRNPLDVMRILVAGWFSFEDGHTTAGDVLARDLTCQWIEAVPCPYDVALDKPFKGGVNWRKVNPQSYSHVIFVCGPFSNGPLEQSFLARFWRCRLIGLNLSMLTPLDRWNPFDLLIERDSSAGGHPDFVIAAGRGWCPSQVYVWSRTIREPLTIWRMPRFEGLRIRTAWPL